MGRIGALLVKELREHLVAGLTLFGLMTLALLLQLLIGVGAKQSMTLLQSWAFFLVSFVPVAGLILGNRLVVSEYHGRTQLFVESLPVRRSEMIAVKFGLGLVVLTAITLGALVLTVLFALRHEPIDGRFLAILTTRGCAFVLFLWSFLFGMGFTGRFRVPIYLALFLALTYLESATELQLSRFGPFALVHFETLPLEREVFPTAAIGVTLALALAWVVIAFALGTLNEGSMAEVLSRRMSQKEKSLVGILFMGLVVAMVALQERSQKEPLEFDEDDVYLSSESQPVEVLYLDEAARDDAAALMAALEEDVRRLRELFGWERVPPLRVALHETLDARTFERAVVRDRDGVVLRANFRRSNPHWSEAAFRAYAVGRLLRTVTEERANFEPRAWFLDGFAQWWTHPDAEPTSLPLLRAAWATRPVSGPLTAAEIRAWFRVRERHGTPVTEGLAFSGLWALERSRGRDAVLALAKAQLGGDLPQDSRMTWREWREPPEETFARATGLGWPLFVQRWNEALDGLRANPDVRRALDRLPSGAASLKVARDQGAIRHLDYAFAFERPPAAGTPCALLHVSLLPFDGELEAHELLRVEHAWRADAHEADFRLPGRYGEGSRAFVALEVESELLGCPLRLLAERRVIE